MQTIDFVGKIDRHLGNNLYCIYGEEAFLIDMAFAALKDQINLEPEDLNYSVFEKKAEESTLVSTIESPPMIAEKRMVHLKNFDQLKQKESQALVDSLARLSEQTVVVFTFLGKPDKRRKLFKLIQKQGVLVEADPLKEEALIGWVIHEAARMKRKLSRPAAKLMMDSCGKDMYTLRNELGKLKVACGEVIGEKEILQYCSKTLDYNVFALHDLLIAKQTKRAIALLHEVLESEKTPSPVLALIAGKFKLMYMGKSCLNAGFSKERAQKSIAAQAGVHPYAARIAVEQCAGFTLEKLIYGIEELAEYDWGLKSGNKSPDEGVERMLLSIYGIV